MMIHSDSTAVILKLKARIRDLEAEVAFLEEESDRLADKLKDNYWDHQEDNFLC